MTALLKPATALSSPDLFDPMARTFATLSPSDRARAGAALRPLPWVDGLITAMALSPAELEPDDWFQHAWLDDGLDKLTPAEVSEVEAIVIDHFQQLFAVLFENPEAYAPFLGDGDALAAASQWAAGFRFGIRLDPEPWAPLIDSDDARTMLGAIFCLEREEDLPEADRPNHPFSDIPTARRQEMAAQAIAVLPAAVRALNELSILLGDTAEANWEAGQTRIRAAPKVGRNEPCPCGSGKKYKKCCFNSAE